MRLEFLSENRIDNKFLGDVLQQLKNDKDKDWSREEAEIIGELCADLENQISSGAKGEPGCRFVLLWNEYNFLIQNDKSLWTRYLIFRYKFDIYPLARKLASFPAHIIVEPVSYCNLKCVMCFQRDDTFSGKREYMGTMDVDLYKHIVDEMVEGGGQALTLTGRGEPTLHPRLGELLGYAKGKFFDFKLNTNAMRLTEEKCHQILESGVTELVFSVDSYEKDEYEKIRCGGKFEQVLANIKMFRDIRTSKYPRAKCRTRISGVKINPDLKTEEFVSFWREYVDYVVCSSMIDRWDTYNNPKTNKVNPCRLLWQRMNIWYDGGTNPCDYDYKGLLKSGHVQDSAIREIWKNEFYSRLREKHLESKRSEFVPCDRCIF
ncbi:MAG: radical SAM protein [Candidatus Omnitrophota bacterium]